MPRALPSRTPLAPVRESTHADDSSSEYDSDESLVIPPAPPMIPPPGGDEDMAKLHGSLLPHLEQITCTSALRAGKNLRYITIPGLVFKNLGFDDMSSDRHLRVLAQLLLFTRHDQLSLDAARGYIVGVSANRRSPHRQPTKLIVDDERIYEVHDAFDARTGLIQYGKKLVSAGRKESDLGNFQDSGWTDVVRYHVEDTAKFCRMLYPATTIKDPLDREEGAWTKWELWDQEDGGLEGGCWSHSKRGVPYMGPYDDGN